MEGREGGGRERERWKGAGGRRRKYLEFEELGRDRLLKRHFDEPFGMLMNHRGRKFVVNVAGALLDRFPKGTM